MYLAGACRDLPDEGTEWRRNAVEKVSLYNKYFQDCKIIAHNPCAYFPRNGNNFISQKQIKQFYMKSIIKKCDLVLVNLNDTQHSVGTGCELQYAECHEIPIIGFGKKNVYEWFPDYCDVVFDTLDEALEYILDYYA